ncbi:uncharacterized protein LOC144630760 [Oculina patagonica]
MSSKCQRRLFQLVVAFAFLCIAASAIILLIIFVLFMEDCVGCRSLLARDLGIAAAVLFIAGLMILLTIICWKRRHCHLNPQVVISRIPTEDLEKSPAPILPYNHIPHRQPFDETSSNDLPDYFTAVQNIDDIWTENVPGTPPPSYEQALEMASLAAATSQEDTELQGDPEDTRL